MMMTIADMVGTDAHLLVLINDRQQMPKWKKNWLIQLSLSDILTDEQTENSAYRDASKTVTSETWSTQQKHQKESSYFNSSSFVHDYQGLIHHALYPRAWSHCGFIKSDYVILQDTTKNNFQHKIVNMIFIQCLDFDRRDVNLKLDIPIDSFGHHYGFPWCLKRDLLKKIRKNNDQRPPNVSDKASK